MAAREGRCTCRTAGRDVRGLSPAACVANTRRLPPPTKGHGLERRTITIRYEEWDSNVLPLVQGRVFHATPKASYDRIAEDGAIRVNQNGMLGDGFFSSMVSFARHYGYVSFYDLRGSAEAVERDLSICHPLMLHQDAEEVCYLILREDAWPSLLPNSEAQPGHFRRVLPS